MATLADVKPWRPRKDTELRLVGDAQPTPDELLALVARGDREAFAALYDLAVPRVFGIARRVLRDPAQAEEVTQEVLLEVWRLAARYDGERGTAMSWITTMAHRRSVDRVRSAQAASDRDVVAGFRGMDRDHDSVSETVEVRLEQQQVRRCLGGLTELQREAVTLAFYRGHTHREVSDLLQVPLGTVKTRLRDGLIRLRDCLGVA